jgi:hypothetical protein
MVDRRRILLAEVSPSVQRPIVPGAWLLADASVVLSNSALTATKITSSGVAWACASGIPIAAGQWYWETQVTIVDGGLAAGIAVGVATAAASLAVQPGFDATGYSIAVGRDGYVRAKGLAIAFVGAIANGAIVRLWLDVDGQRLFVAVNGGVWLPCPLPASMLGVGLRPIVGFLRPFGATASATANFGASAFAYAVPDGANTGLYVKEAPVPTTFYLGSEGFDYVPPKSKGGLDYAAAQRYVSRIAFDSDVDLSCEGGCWVWGNQSTASYGQVVLVNVDGGLDAWLTYEWRGAPITLLSGYEGDAYEDYTLWTETVVDRMSATRDGRLILHLCDPLSLYDRALQMQLYPDDQANSQAAAQPGLIVIGRPLYCEGVLLDPNPIVRDYDLHAPITGYSAPGGPVTVAGDGIASISAIYDRGNLFKGPNDPYFAHNPVTLANGGAFTTWAADTAGVQMPQNWARVTGFTAGDRFQQGVAAGTLRMLSTGQATTTIAHTASSVQVGYRYTISCTVTAVPKAGQVIFRAANTTSKLPHDDVVVAITAVGTLSIVLDVASPAVFQIVLGRTELDATIDDLTVSSVKVEDWQYRSAGANRVGFHLANAPAGKIVANPVGPNAGGVIEHLGDVLNYVLWRGWINAGAIGTAPDVTDAASAITARANYRIATFERRPVTALALLRDIMDSWCGWIAPRRDGSLTVGRVIAPEGVRSAPVVTLDDTNLIGEVEVSDDLAKGLTVRIAGRRNHSVHADGDLATTVSPTLRAELTTEMTCVRTGAPAISRTPVSATYAQAVGAPPKATLLQEPSDIQIEANQVATLWRPTRRFYVVTALLGASIADTLEPGQVVHLVWPGYGLQAGKNLLVIGVRRRFFSRRVDLKLWG